MSTRGVFPGLRFVVQPPPIERRLPRMDVVGFVGLSASGPLHVPVVIENTGQFEAIFGADVEVRVDAGRRGLLAPTVRSFFANGGRRCWVVRVAGPGAVANTFDLPGVQGYVGGAPSQAVVQARSAGSWADALRLSTTIERRSVRITRLEVAADGSVSATLGVGQTVAPGDLLWADLDDDKKLTWFVTEVDEPTTALLGRVVRGEAALQRKDGVADTVPAGLTVVSEVSVLTLSVEVRQAGGTPSIVRGLGFHPTHPRHWRRLPTDQSLFGLRDARPAWWSDVADPRLPVAGILDLSTFDLPTLKLVHHGKAGPTASAPVDAAWQRDGLSSFDPSWFVDTTFQSDSLRGVERRFSDQLLDPDKTAVVGAMLRGVHALATVDEVTLLSVPDLQQPAWQITEAGAASVTVVSPPPGFFPCGTGPLSTPRWVTTTPAPPADPTDRSRDGHLCWTGGAAQAFHVQLAGRADFLDATTVALTPSTSIDVPSAGAAQYWRVRAEHQGQVGTWSAVLEIRPAPAALIAAAPANALTPADVQRAILRLCAVRGDLFALFAMPAGTNSGSVRGAALDALQELREPSGTPSVPSLLTDERRALSYGAAFAPWLLVREGDALREVPPDGAVAGVFAARALREGAWVAPANVAFRDVPVPASAVLPADWVALDVSGVNTILRQPWGVLSLGSHTLADPEDEVQQIGVRRLLSLLRRLALSEGLTWVFEPDGPDLRRAVRSGFEATLRELFRRGAFAGNQPGEAFRVGLADRPDDTGRLIVELRVAPSHPLRFLTVRLVRTDLQRLVAEEV